MTIEQAYQRYTDYFKDKPFESRWLNREHVRQYYNIEFTDALLTDDDMYLKWGRECDDIKVLDIKERINLYMDLHPTWVMIPDHHFFDAHHIPKRALSEFFIKAN
jgi:hypothetical protein